MNASLGVIFVTKVFLRILNNNNTIAMSILETAIIGMI